MARVGAPLKIVCVSLPRLGFFGSLGARHRWTTHSDKPSPSPYILDAHSIGRHGWAYHGGERRCLEDSDHAGDPIDFVDQPRHSTFIAEFRESRSADSTDS